MAAMTSHLTFGLGALGAMLLTASATAQTPAPTESPVATASPSPTAAPAAIEAEPPVTQKVLEKYDTNKDGVLSPEERAVWEKDRAARRAARLKKYDKNGDGKLDESERAAMRKDKEAEKAAKEAEKIKEQEKPGQ
jgi:hypothetical protein